MLGLQTIVPACHHPGRIAKSRVSGHILHPLAMDVDFPSITDAVKKFFTGIGAANLCFTHVCLPVWCTCDVLPKSGKHLRCGYRADRPLEHRAALKFHAGRITDRRAFADTPWLPLNASPGTPSKTKWVYIDTFRA